MRTPRVRLRTLMIAVAVAALACYGQILLGRLWYHRNRASYHARAEVEARRALAEYRAGRVILRGIDPVEAEALADRIARSIPYHAEQRRKWERAARRPWLPVPPDPPAPE